MRYQPNGQPMPGMQQNQMHQQPAPRVYQNQPERNNAPHHSSAPKNTNPPKKEDQKCGCCEKKEKNILEKFLPENIYNPKTKKLFGILTSEELLLVALIFIVLSSDKEDSNLMCLALLYLLFADKFDLGNILK